MVGGLTLALLETFYLVWCGTSGEIEHLVKCSALLLGGGGHSASWGGGHSASGGGGGTLLLGGGGTGIGKLLQWIQIFTLCTNREDLVLDRLSTFRKSGGICNYALPYESQRLLPRSSTLFHISSVTCKHVL